MSKKFSSSLIDMEFDYIEGLRRRKISDTDVMKLRDKVLANEIVPKKISQKKVSEVSVWRKIDDMTMNFLLSCYCS